MTPPDPALNQKTNQRAIAWAMLSQSIWIPCFFSDTQDWLTSRRTDFDFSSTVKLPHQHLPSSISSNPKLQPYTGILSISQKNNLNDAGIILNSQQSIKSLFSQTSIQQHPSSPSLSPVAFKPPPKQLIDLSHLARPSNPKFLKGQTIYTAIRSTDIIKKIFSQSDLLGGTLSLNDIHEAEMPAIARAERAQLIRSGDPLAVIPSSWRESMRKALNSLTNNHQNDNKFSYPASTKAVSTILLEPARIVHVPSSRVKRQTQVPLALQSDGTVDILNQPDTPEIVEEIKHWSTKQQLPMHGRMAPAVVHLHPLMEIEMNRQQPDAHARTKFSRPPAIVDSSTSSDPVKTPTPSPAISEIKSVELASPASQGAIPLESPEKTAASIPSPTNGSGVVSTADAPSNGGLNP